MTHGLRRVGRWPLGVLRFLTVTNAREHVRAINPRRLIGLGVLIALGVPAVVLLMRRGWPVEDAVNIVTLALVGTCFLVKSVCSGVLTVIWTPLAKALTAMAALLAVLFYLGVINAFWADVVPVHLRWALRFDLIFWIVVFTDAVISRFIATRHAAQAWPDTIGTLADVSRGLRGGLLHPAEAAELIEEAVTRLRVPEGAA